MKGKIYFIFIKINNKLLISFYWFRNKKFLEAIAISIFSSS